MRYPGGMGYGRAVAAGVLLGVVASHSSDLIDLIDDTSTVSVALLLVIVLLLIVPDIATTYRIAKGDHRDDDDDATPGSL